MRISIPLLLCLMHFSCATRNLVYFSDLPQDVVTEEAIPHPTEALIQPNDYLSIRVNTLNPETNMLFNTGVISSFGSNAAAGGTGASANDGYRVDRNGDISFPILGKVALGGVTIDEATEKLTKLLESEAKNPIVNIKLLNFKITVVGEVSNPNTFPISTESINIIEAIGLAGDLTAYGKRENVLLIRVKDGVRTTARLDLNNKDIFLSPYFYLQQNDVVYVEPVRARAEQASMSRSNISLVFSVISIATTLLARFVL